MEVHEVQDPAAPGVAGSATAEDPVLPRGRAIAYVVGVFLAWGAGWWAYAALAPDVGILDVELQRGGGAGDLPDGTAEAVGWDFLFILGYGLALYLATKLARAVFRSTGARKIAAAAQALVGVAVAADVVENVLLLVAAGPLSGSTAGEGLLRDAVTAAAILKFSCLVPAMVVALTAVAVSVARLCFHRSPRLSARPTVTVRPPDPLEGDPPDRRPDDDPAAEDGSRWRRGYRVPGVDAADRQGPVRGVCLSGGGIRSGSVALGALQSLREELLGARYLVSVSGGGYTAGALQLALTKADGRTLRPGEKRPEVLADPSSAYMPGSAEEDRFRRHARYLADSPSQLVVALGIVARVLLLSLAVLFAPGLVLGVVIGEYYRALPLASFRSGDLELTAPQVATGTWYVCWFLAVVAFLAYLSALVLVAYTPFPGAWARAVARGATALVVLVLLVGAGVPWLVYGAGWLLEQASDTTLRIGGPVLGVVVTYAVTLASFLRKKKVFDSTAGPFRKKKGGGSVVGAVPGGALQLIMVVLTLTLLAAAWLLLAGGTAAVATGPDRTTALWTAGAVLLVLVLLGGLLDQTALSLHPFYRRRLAAAFAARRVKRPDDGHVVAEGYQYEEGTPLPTYGARVEGFPQVVFSCAANLSGETRAPLKATSFTMGADWLGGPDVGYMHTGELRDAVDPSFWRDLTVQAAVAISGAAFASAAGRATRWYTTLLAVTGLRLGTWLPNPAFVQRWNEAKANDDWTRPGLPKLRRLSYLLREVLGSHRYTDRLLQITDGGHYENLGLVDTLRRRCTEIYCIDASGDRPPTAGTFEQAITLAYAELGVRILLDEEAWRLVPGGGTPIPPHDPLSRLNKRLSDRAVATATICYPPESGLPPDQRHGVLVFAKALLTPDMSYQLLSYAARHPVFPHDTTGDQFFDDDKYTAYSALGREIGEDAGQVMAEARRRLRSDPRCPLGPDCPSASPKASRAEDARSGEPPAEESPAGPPREAASPVVPAQSSWTSPGLPGLWS